jgi:hypothetical protein
LFCFFVVVLNSRFWACTILLELCLQPKRLLGKWKHLKCAEALEKEQECVGVFMCTEGRGVKVSLWLGKHWRPDRVLYMRGFIEC